LTDRVPDLRDRHFAVAPRRIDEHLAVERRIEEHAELAGVSLAVLRLDPFALERNSFIEAAGGGSGEGCSGEDDAESLHGPCLHSKLSAEAKRQRSWIAA
jgi:hypothetical protein